MAPLEARSPLPSQAGPRARAADGLAAVLAAAGARRAFGIPGGEVLRLIEALGRAGIPFVGARHENAAGYMAAGAHRASGELGLLVATLGPGVANAVGPAAHALQDDLPLVILGGRAALASPPEFRHQVIDQCALFAPVTKGCFVLRAGRAREIATEAVRLALAEPRGPVYIDCPLDEVEAEGGSDHGFAAEPPAPPEAAACERLAALLDEARRPLALAGLGALRPGVPETLARLLRVRPMPVLTTYEAKGVLSERHDLALGAAGLSPLADELLLPFVGRADLVLAIGYDPIEMRSNWNRPFAPSARVAALGPEAARRTGPAATDAVAGRLDLLLDELAARAKPRPLDAGSAREIATLREALARAFAPRAAWEPARLLADLEDMLGPDDLVTVDTGAHRILLAQLWRMERPGRLLQSAGFCSMACALPMAIGAKIAAPERRVVCVVGDGGLEMAPGELATLRDLGLPLVVVVIDDGGYALIDQKQRARGFPSAGVDFGRSDLAALARAFGGRGRLARDRAAFAAAMAAALAAPAGFELVQAVFPRRSYDGRI